VAKFFRVSDDIWVKKRIKKGETLQMKKILWLVNIPLPEVSMLMNEPTVPFGGWLVNTAKELADDDGIKLFIAFPQKKIKGYKALSGEKIEYFAFARIRKNKAHLVKSLDMILDKTTPLLVHIHGTEYLHTLAIVDLCRKKAIKTVISIQGLLSITAQHFYASLPTKAIFGFTLRNLLNRDSVYLEKKSFEKIGISETNALKKIEHVIGRTTWDRTNLLQINPKINYYFCNEMLRESFYKHKWGLESCERNTIFLSQGRDSYKGLHNAIESLPLILRRFPNAKVYMAGVDITKVDTLEALLFRTYYGKYIRRRIWELRLQDHVFFTGVLAEPEMCERYLRSHVFLCPSSIENSPNSLGEAMILGVPCVASYVGGIPDLLEHQKEGLLYQADAPYMLAHYICELFSNDNMALEFSRSARKRALVTHSKNRNLQQLLQIYGELSENGKPASKCCNSDI